jgi:hypothetical protein
MLTDTWSEIGPGSITGFGAQSDGGSGGVRSGVTSAVATASGSAAPIYSPDNPLFWVGILLLTIGGAVGLSGWVDVGPIKGKASV